MKVLVIGVRKVSFNAQDGNSVNGHSVYYSYEAPNVEGVVSERVFVPARFQFVPSVGEIISISYNRYGKLASIEPV